jgi:hypothetical protein
MEREMCSYLEWKLTVDDLISLNIICDDTYSINSASGDESDGKRDM